jgi:hypothetical protein
MHKVQLSRIELFNNALRISGIILICEERKVDKISKGLSRTISGRGNYENSLGKQVWPFFWSLPKTNFPR